MAGHKRESGVHKQETNKDGEIQSVSQAMEKDKTASNPPSTSLLQTHRKHQVVQQKKKVAGSKIRKEDAAIPCSCPS